MDEQQLRDEIEAARSSRFPSTSLEQMKASLRDVYYKAINEEKILAINVPEDKKEAHIQNILNIAEKIEEVEQDIINEESTWSRPDGAIIDLDETTLFWSSLCSAYNVSSAKGSFSEELKVGGSSVRTQADPPCVDLSSVWPIGSVFLSVVNTNPSTLLGFGSWESIAAGRVLLGKDTGDVDFDANEKVGGAKNKTLSTPELPIHSHPVNDPGHKHNMVITRTLNSGPSTTHVSHSQDNSSTILPQMTENNTTGISVGNTGSGQSFSLMNPYFCVSVWKRVE